MAATNIVEAVMPEPSPWNISSTLNLDDLKMDSNFALLLVSLFSAMVWVIYITYYNSRLIGFIFTRAVNKFYTTDGYFKVGKLNYYKINVVAICCIYINI